MGKNKKNNNKVNNDIKVNDIKDNLKIHKGILLLIIIVAIVQIVFYIYTIIKTLDKYSLLQYLPIFLNIMMYTSIIRYIVDYFYKHKEVSLESMIVRYVASLVSVLIKLKGNNDPTFLFIVLVVFLASYLAGLLRSRSKIKCNILIFAVLILSVIISAIRIINPNIESMQILGRFIYCCDACNIAIEWFLFTVLYVLRFFYSKNIKNSK